MKGVESLAQGGDQGSWSPLPRQMDGLIIEGKVFPENGNIIQHPQSHTRVGGIT